MSDLQQDYVRALRFRWLTSIYDPVVYWTTREATFKQQLVAQAALRPGLRVLDAGCRTGTLAILMKRQVPGLDVIGIDGDPDVLGQASAKATETGVTVAFDRGLLDALPYPDGSFDRVVSSLVFHHLPRATKRRALGEIVRVLRPGGQLHVADWGSPHGPAMRAAFFFIQLLDGFETTQDSVRGVLPTLIRDAGLIEVVETHRLRTMFGSMCLYRASRPSEIP